jgi:epidermal growth factor receptor substrate 15
MKRNTFAMFVGTLALFVGGAGIAVAADEQVAGQQAASSQSASSNATSTQTDPTNQNIDVRIFSPGDAGAVTQTNSSAAASAAANANTTDQSAQQQQAGGAGGTQAAGQAASSSQTAASDATSTQTKPTNSNIAVRIDSPGNAGAVTQTNSSAAESAAANLNKTDQSANQAQAGGACCAGTSGGTQAVGQKADNTQDATSSATSTQTKPTNSNISVRIDSPGNAGAVTQTNSSSAASLAANANKADQSATQQQAGGACCASGGTQAVGQAAKNDQSATSDATSTQVKPTNQNIPVRIGSPGNDGTVTQTNSSAAASAALNANKLDQTATQTQGGSACCGSGAGTQAIGQKAVSDQDATSDATSTQYKPSNTNAPVRIGSEGSDGTVEQTNVSSAESLAANLNHTSQSATQSQAGGMCCKDDTKDVKKDDTCCAGGIGIQGVEQVAKNDQDADSSATSTQSGASNSNTPVRIGSAGGGGTVEQTNASLAASAALNANKLDQTATQTQGGSLGTGVQAIGQFAESSQDASSDATSTQIMPSNTNAPVRIGSNGNDGSVKQSNISAAESLAANLNHTSQSATQSQAGGACGCGGTGVQAIGQKADNDQWADSDATSTQSGANNSNTPVRIGSAGGGGTVEQTNASLAASAALNANKLDQTATQTQGGSLGTGVQAIGQKATSAQDADSSATSWQYMPSNSSAPVRIASKGDDGSLKQSNLSAAESLAANLNHTSQSATQTQAGRACCTDKPSYGPEPQYGYQDDKKDNRCCHNGTGVQAAGQFAANWQAADSSATSKQYMPSNHNAPLREWSYGGGGYVTQANASFAASLAANANALKQTSMQ